MEYHIDLLITMYQMDLFIKSRRDFIDGFPARLAGLEQEQQAAESRMNEEAAALEETRKALRRKERDLEDGENQLRQSQVKIQSSKTNREYEAGLKEIEEQKNHKSELESQVLQMMEELERHEHTVKDLEKECARSREELKQKRAMLESVKSKAEKDVKEAEFERNKIAPDIPKDMIETYQRLQNHYGNAVARAKNEICTACNFHIPPQLYNEVLRAERMIVCSNCRRILVSREKDLLEEIEPLIG